MRTLHVALAVMVSAGAVSAQETWERTADLTVAIREAEDLYAAEPVYDPYAAIAIGGRAKELAAMYAGLDSKLPPMRIYTFGADADADAIDYSQIPTSFAEGSPEDRIVRFIRQFEAGARGYDAVWAGNKTPLPRRPTEMTVCEVRDWQIAAARRQKSAAIGLYQIVGGTFRTVLSNLELPCDTKFDAATQDRIGLALLYGRGWQEFKAGTMSVEDFAFELAGEWAAFPAPYGKDKGFSRYRNIAGNRHLIGLPEYLAFLRGLRAEISQKDSVAETVAPEEDDVGVAAQEDEVLLVEANPDRQMQRASLSADPAIQIVTFAD